MKDILKLIVFMVLGLLLVSCSKSSSISKNEAGIQLKGVLEKGKATDAVCEISTLDGKVYSESNHIENGEYFAIVQAGAFDIKCTIKKYIDDKTGEEITPKPSIVLEAISFAKEGENKTLNVNVNVITDLVAKAIDKNKITNETTFNIVRKDAKATALQGILSKLGQSTIEDIDTLSLQDKGILAQVSLAVQAQFNQDSSITIEQALKKAIAANDANSIANQDVNDLNPKAIAKLPTNIQTPKPTGQVTGTTITLTGATIGGEDVTSSPTNIDASNAVLFSIPANDLGEVADTDSVYITSDQVGQTTPKKLEGGKSAPYTANDVKGLFKPNDVTTFTICVVPIMAPPLGSADNGQCLSASVKVTFRATAVSGTGTGTPTSGTGTGTPAVSGTGTGTPASGTVTPSSLADLKSPIEVLVAGENVLDGSNEINGSGAVTFSMPKTVVTKLPTESVYITSFKVNTVLPLTLKGSSYTNDNIKSLLFPVGKPTVLIVCLLSTTPTPDTTSCRTALIKRTLTVAVKGFNMSKISEVTIGTSHIGTNLKSALLVENTPTIMFSMPTTFVTKSPSEAVYITSTNFVRPAPRKLELVGDKYQLDIKNLFGPNYEVAIILCIYSKDTAPDFVTCFKASGGTIVFTNSFHFNTQYYDRLLFPEMKLRS